MCVCGVCMYVDVHVCWGCEDACACVPVWVCVCVRVHLHVCLCRV